MPKSKRIKRLSNKGPADWYGHLHLVSGLVGIAVSLFGLLTSLFVSTSGSKQLRVPMTNGLLYFVGGIVMLGFVVVAIAILIQRKNRDVTLLKQRLSEIYLFALKESALNPQSHMTSHE